MVVESANVDEAQPERWDPFWEYVLGSSEKKATQRGDDDDGDNGFLDYLFPPADDGYDDDGGGGGDDVRDAPQESRGTVETDVSDRRDSGEKKRRFWKRKTKRGRGGDEEPRHRINQKVGQDRSARKQLWKRKNKPVEDVRMKEIEEPPKPVVSRILPSIGITRAEAAPIPSRESIASPQSSFSAISSIRSWEAQRQNARSPSPPKYVPPSVLVKKRSNQKPTSQRRVSFAPLPPHYDPHYDTENDESSGRTKSSISEEEHLVDSFLTNFVDSWNDYDSEGEYTNSVSSFEASTKESSSIYTEDLTTSDETATVSSRDGVVTNQHLANEIGGNRQFSPEYGNLLPPLGTPEDDTFVSKSSLTNGMIVERDLPNKVQDLDEQNTLAGSAASFHFQDTLHEDVPATRSATIYSDPVDYPQSISSPVESFSEIESISPEETSGNRNGVGRLVCCSIKDVPHELALWSMKTGIPVHELSHEELAELFPKLRMVADEKRVGYGSEVVGNANSFEEQFPAHLQLPEKAVIAGSGPQSLYEYEYSRGTHMKVVYEEFGRNPRSVLKVRSYEKPPVQINGERTDERVIVQVEASTVSQTDCAIRRGEVFCGEVARLPATPGVDFVGRIYRIDNKSSKRHKLSKGNVVLSLVKMGGNARFISAEASKLVKVPDHVDPAEAACLVETYLSAFQALNYGQNPSSRYRKSSLKGKTVFIHGPVTSNIGRAIAQLAVDAGVENVFATAEPKNVKDTMSMGVIPLSLDPVDWWEDLMGSIDVFIAVNEKVMPLHYKLLKASGNIIFAGNESELTPDQKSLATRVVCSGRGKTERTSKSHRLDVYRSWETDNARCRKDLTYLLGLLQQGRLEPRILDRIPLTKVARAQELVEIKRNPGFLVCEPWLISKSRAITL